MRLPIIGDFPEEFAVMGTLKALSILPVDKAVWRITIRESRTLLELPMVVEPTVEKGGQTVDI